MSTLVTQETNGPAPIGRHLAEWRIRRGLTASRLAARCGLPEQSITDLESGRDWVDRRRVVNSLAAGLRLDPIELTGQPYLPYGASHAVVHATAWHVRRHLARVVAGGAGMQDPVHAEEVAALVAAVRSADEGGDLHSAADGLPRLLEMTASPVTDASLRSEASVAAARLLRRLGYRDLAYSVLHRARPPGGAPTPLEMAEEVWLLLDMGRPALAVSRAPGPEAVLPVDVLLPLALAHACLGQWVHSARLLERAQTIAHAPKEVSAVASARAFAEAERGAFEQVLAHAGEAGYLPPGERAGLFLLTASARARLGRVGEAVTDLVTAESVAPLHTRLNPLARELVHVLSSCPGVHGDGPKEMAARFGMK